MFSIFKMTNEKYIRRLREHGAVIGENTVFFSPQNTSFDLGKAFLIKIGSYCKITSGVTIIAHDYSRSVARMCFGENVGGCAPVSIGDNCFVGMNATLLMGTTVGNNCIIGAGAVVKGTFPDNSVIAGNPARVICDLETYYRKRKEAVLSEALQCVKHVYENSGKVPTIRQMGDGYAWLYLPHTEKTLEQYPFLLSLKADNPSQIRENFLNSTPLFDGYEEFLSYACKELGIIVTMP